MCRCESFEQFAKHCPLTVMVRILLEAALSKEALDEVFEKTAQGTPKSVLQLQGFAQLQRKISSRWQPRYLVYPGSVALPEVVVTLIRADSGDRLLDYFKPSA